MQMDETVPDSSAILCSDQAFIIPFKSETCTAKQVVLCETSAANSF